MKHLKGATMGRLIDDEELKKTMRKMLDYDKEYSPHELGFCIDDTPNARGRGGKDCTQCKYIWKRMNEKHEKVLQDIDEEIAITRDYLENVINDITMTDHIKRMAKAECNAEIRTLEWVKGLFAK